MAYCKKCKCNKKYCGCSDAAKPVAPPCGQETPECPSPEPCAEHFSDECIIHTGDSIVDLGINQGDRLSVILQKLSLWITNPDCADQDACQGVVGLKSTYISETIIKLAWINNPYASYYNVEYKTAASSTWTTNPAVQPGANPIDTIMGLVGDQEYYIRVKVVCPPIAPNPAEVCYSPIISVTTLE